MSSVYSQRFEACLPFVLKEEGGYSCVTGDAGGATNFGITQREYWSWLSTQGLPLANVKNITPAHYRAIYWENYWQPHCPEVLVGLDLTLFNINVNGGAGRGTRLLQQALGLRVDGIWGEETARAVASLTDAVPIVVRFHAFERAFYEAIVRSEPSQAKFLSDWLGRNDRCEQLAMAMIQGESQANV